MKNKLGHSLSHHNYEVGHIKDILEHQDFTPQAHGLALLTRMASPSDTCKLCTAVELGSLKLFVPGPD